MSNRLNKVRRELEKKRRQIDSSRKGRERAIPLLMNRHEESREDFDIYVHQEKEDREQRGRSGDFLVFRIMTAVCLALVIAILFKSTSPQLDGMKAFITDAYEQELQFAAIANWYENQFGRPLALVPVNQEMAQGDPEEQVEMVYALPAAGTIREDFQQNGSGILIETGLEADVEAVKGGYVISVGEREEENLGKTVVVQHYDGTESLYGMLDDISVKMYDHIQAGAKIGTVSINEEAQKGIFYFALKKDEHYIDPTDVLSFE